MSITSSRERFEAWLPLPTSSWPSVSVAHDGSKQRLDTGYLNPLVEAAWRGWQAAEADALERAAEIADRNDRLGWGGRIAAAIRKLKGGE